MTTTATTTTTTTTTTKAEPLRKSEIRPDFIDVVEKTKVGSVTELDDVGEVADTETGQTLEIISVSDRGMTGLLAGDATEEVFEPVELIPTPYCINFSTADIDPFFAYGGRSAKGFGDGILGYEIFYESGESAFKKPEVLMSDGASLATCHSSMSKITLTNYQGDGWFGHVYVWNINTGQNLL